MNKLLSREQVLAYQNDGVLFPVPALTREEANQFRANLDDLEARLGGRPKAVELAEVHLYFRWAYDLVTHPRILDAMEDLLGPDILVWASSIFTKYPYDKSFVSWHQDGTYWGLDSPDVITVWVALTDAALENGCMRMLPGSHRAPIQSHEDTWAEDNLLTRGQRVRGAVREDEAVHIVLRAGEISIHHPNMIHSSGPNATETKRVGFTIRYLRPDVVQTGMEQEVIVARGEDRQGNFKHCEFPPLEDVAQALAAHAEASRRHVAAIRSASGAFSDRAKQ